MSVLFARWGRFIVRHRIAVLALSALCLLASAASLLRGAPLSATTIPGLESERARRLIEASLGQAGASSFRIVFEAPNPGPDLRDPALREAMTRTLAPVRAAPGIASVQAPDGALDPVTERLLSADRRFAVAEVTLASEFNQAVRQYHELRPQIQSDRLRLVLTGHLAFIADLDRTLERDLFRAEAVSMPMALIVLVLVFGGLVAAVLPVAVGGLAVAAGLAAVMLLARVTNVAQYTLNVVTLVGLGVSIDYSLFLTSRFRDERARGVGVDEAVVTSVATAGRAAVFSAATVMVGLGGLFFFRGSVLPALAAGGAIVVGLGALFALSFLPALLAVLGPRIDAGRLPWSSRARADGMWRRLALAVMRRPVTFLVVALAAVCVVGEPARHLRTAAADVRSLPQSVGARQGHDLLAAHFPELVANRVVAAINFPTAPALTPERIDALYDYTRRLGRLPGVAKVESIVSLSPLLGRDDYRRILLDPPPAYRDLLELAKRQMVGGQVAVVSIVTRDPPESDQARRLVRLVRQDRQVGDGTAIVTGQTAMDVDNLDYLLGHAHQAVAFVLGVTLLVLFILLRSVVLPIKAVLMNLLSIAASFGALVWIFQQGHLSGLLGFEPRPIDPNLPVLLFCALFGLSMDYEVLMLARMQEEYLRSGDNTRAVAEGLERSGRLVTSAATIMVAVFAAFALARVVMVQSMGVSMAIAVAIDATLVRVLLVPSTMRLLGEWNWWMPRALRRRVGATRSTAP